MNPLVLHFQESEKAFTEDVMPGIVIRCKSVADAEYTVKKLEMAHLESFLSFIEAEIARGEGMKAVEDKYVKRNMTTANLEGQTVGYNYALTSFLALYYEARDWAKERLSDLTK